jgi:hypothetical protein
MSTRFVSWLAIAIGGAFLVIATAAFSLSTVAWLAFAISIGTPAVHSLEASPSEGEHQRDEEPLMALSFACGNVPVGSGDPPLGRSPGESRNHTVSQQIGDGRADRRRGGSRLRLQVDVAEQAVGGTRESLVREPGEHVARGDPEGVSGQE